MPMYRFIVILALFGLSTNLLAVQRYLTSVEASRWHVYGSPIFCEMVHEITHYGKVRFVYSSGGEIAFQLQTLEAAPRESVASLYSDSPFWRPNKQKELAQLTISKGYMPVYVGGDLARRIMYELQAGQQPTFHYKDWASFDDDVFVSISSVKFHQKIDEFKQCVSDALPYGSDKVKDTAIFFGSDTKWSHGLLTRESVVNSVVDDFDEIFLAYVKNTDGYISRQISS